MENRFQELSKTRQSDETEQQRQVRAGLARLFLPLLRFYLPLGLPGFHRPPRPPSLPSGGGGNVEAAEQPFPRLLFLPGGRCPSLTDRPSAIFHSTFLVQD